FPFGVWLAEPEGKLLYVSPCFLRLARTDLRELRQKGKFHFLSPEACEVAEQGWARSRETREPLDIEYTHRFDDGPDPTIWTRCAAAARGRTFGTGGVLARARGGLPSGVGVNIDVRGRRQIREELHGQADTLRKQAAALKEADRRKDEFLALLGHELRNPLAP